MSVHDFQIKKASNAADELKQYVFIEDINKFINKKTGQLKGIQSFNLGRSNLNIRDDQGKKVKDIGTYGIEEGYITCADSSMYYPGKKEIYEIPGSGIYYNTFRGFAQLPQCELKKETIQAVDRWMISLTGKENSEESWYLLRYLAYIARNPGCKLNYGMYIQGSQRSGKSTIERVMSAILGDRNTRKIYTQDIKSSFNAWASDGVFALIDEFSERDNKAKESIYCRLKSPVADSRISITKKGHDPAFIHNFQNYVLTANQKDALKIEPDDSKFYVVLEHQIEPDDLAALLGYDGRLYGSETDKSSRKRLIRETFFHDQFTPIIDNEPEQFMAYFESLDLSEFNPRVVPDSRKNKMIISGQGKGLIEEVIDEVLEESNHITLNKDYLSVKSLDSVIRQKMPELRLGSNDITDYLRSCGYTSARIWDGNKQLRLWYAPHLSPEQVRQSILWRKSR